MLASSMKEHTGDAALASDGYPRRQTELEAAFARFVALSYSDQLDLRARVEEHLRLSQTAGAQPDDVYAKRQDTLACLRQVRAHLGLESGPTYPQYLEASRELKLPWSGQQIQRLWVRWQDAINALESGRPPRSAAARSFAKAQVGRKRSREEYWSAVRRWLATDPPRDFGVDYDDWAREHNASADGDAVPRRNTIVAALVLPWREVLAIGRDEKTADVVVVDRRAKRDWSQGRTASSAWRP